MAKRSGWEEVWLERIADSLEGMKYGSVHIVIHDGKIVQIERTEKRRFDGVETIHPSNNQKQG